MCKLHSMRIQTIEKWLEIPIWYVKKCGFIAERMTKFPIIKEILIRNKSISQSNVHELYLLTWNVPCQNNGLIGQWAFEWEFNVCVTKIKATRTFDWTRHVPIKKARNGVKMDLNENYANLCLFLFRLSCDSIVHSLNVSIDDPRVFFQHSNKLN